MNEITGLNQDKVFSTTRLLKKAEGSFVTNFKNYGGLRKEGWKKEPVEGEPVVSIITVVKNDITHIEETILSVLNQTYGNVEYVVVDGASTDGTLEVIKKYQKYIDLWVSEPDKGVCYGFNRGVDLVTGNWVEFLNSGDFLYNNTVLADIFSGKKIDSDGVYGSMVGCVDGRRVLVEAHEKVEENA